MNDDALNSWIGSSIILDTDGHLLYIGTLRAIHPQYLELDDADVHDIRSTETTKDKYIHQATKLGHHPNRTKVLVMKEKIYSLSRMDDVIKF